MAALSGFVWGVDILLGIGMIYLIVYMLYVRSLYRAIILFVMFSLFLALVWVRLSAPDIALAEASIGAGLTGALLISAYARLNSMKENVKDNFDGDG